MDFQQEVDGKRVVGSLVRGSFDEAGNPPTVSRRLSNGNRSAGANSLSAVEAVNLAAALAHDGAPSLSGNGRKVSQTTSFDRGSFFHADPSAEEVIVANRGGRMEPGWLVTTWTQADNQLVETVINARGRVISTENRTADDSYNTFQDHPLISNQTIKQGPGSTTESPNGWLGTDTQYTTLISGNNVRAYLDRTNDSVPDNVGPVVTDGNFDTVALLNQAPTVTANQEVAVQNLFWLSNIIHDELYRHGFVEATGNFQEDNFGRGGAGSDSVDAEAQDGGSTNNANFATPSDGSNPRMQMYLWTTTNPGRDGDLDSDIVWHEYGHGLTWRMIGSMSGSISGAIGEGMSDVLAIIMNDQPTVGEYSTDNFVRGIRRYSYEGYPLTLGSFTGSSVHSDGEIYAATLWDMKKRYEAAGYTRDDIMGDIVDGMNFTAPGPDYLDMRNGILDAAPAERDCLEWESFAAFGMGPSAAMGTRGRRVTVTEDFAVPSSSSATASSTTSGWRANSALGHVGDLRPKPLARHGQPDGQRVWSDRWL